MPRDSSLRALRTAQKARVLSFSNKAQRTADVLVNILEEAGVDVIFGIPGGAIAPVHDALLGRRAIRVITTRHEAGAAFSAAGYARTTGRLGVVLVTSGPGLLNALTGIASAYCDGLPVLILAGEVPRSLHGRGALQEGSAYHLNVVAIASHVTKLAFEVPDPNTAPTMLRRAMATALSGRPGPVVVTLPLDVTMAPIRPTRTNLRVHTSFTVPAEIVEPVAHLLKTSERSVVFAGAGMRNGQGPQELLSFAEHLQIPVMTTPKGKGVFPERHPLSLGVFGLGGHPSAQEFLEEGADVLLALGTSLGDVATDGWSELLKPRHALVHVDVEASRLGRSYPADVSLVAPADVVLAALRECIPANTERRAFGIRRHVLQDGLDPTCMHPKHAIEEIQHALPDNAIYAVDAGEHSLYATQYLEIDHADAYIAMTGLGSMGSSIGAAIGAQLAYPERTVAVIIGDGGFAMVGTEVGTAAALELPLLVFVINDGRLGMCEVGHTTVFGRTPYYPVQCLDVAGFAAANGADSLVVRRGGEITAAVSRRRRRPLVLDVRIDPAIRLPRRDRIQSLRRSALRKV